MRSSNDCLPLFAAAADPSLCQRLLDLVAHPLTELSRSSVILDGGLESGTLASANLYWLWSVSSEYPHTSWNCNVIAALCNLYCIAMTFIAMTSVTINIFAIKF